MSLNNILTVISLLFITNFITAQSSTATYTSGNIPTGDDEWPGGCTASTLTVSVPIGAIVTGVDVAYNIRALNGGWKSEQRSQLFCQETSNDEGGYISGIEGASGIEAYSRTGLTLANGVSGSGSLTFEMRAYRTWSESGYEGCSVRNNRVLNNTWVITVNYTLPPSIGGYLGPGGVGKIDGTSALETWLRADDLNADNDFSNNPADGASVSAWNDYSGNGKNYTISGVHRPTYNSAGTFNAVNFNASLPEAQYLTTASGGVYTEGSAFFATNPVNDGNSVGAFENETYALRIEQWNNTNRIGFTHYGTGDYQSTLVTPFNVNSIISWHKDAASSNMTIYSNGSSNTFGIGGASKGIPYDRIGRDFTGTDEASGDIFEVILYSQKLNTAERIIVNNYLSAKYGSIAVANDFYTNDNPVNGNFDHDVAGIGQHTDGSKHIDSQGTGIIRINTPSALSNDDFLFWGEETKNPTYSFSTVTSDYTERLNSKWRVSKRNDLGTVSVHINASNLDLSGYNCGSLRFIVSNTADFSTKTTYNMSLSGGVYTATGVSFSDGNYFSVEYTDVIAVDGTQFYNGAGSGNVPNTTDDCYKLLVKSTATGSLSLTENADVREVEVEAGGKLVVNNGFRLQVTNGINNSGEVRMIGNAQLLQMHTGVSENTGTGKLYMDQMGVLTNVYQSGYWSSPVTTAGSTFTINNVLKDGTNPTTATGGVTEAQDITFTDAYNGAKTTPITISRRWLAKLVNAVDWTRYTGFNENSTLNPGEGWNMKSTGGGVQNYTFVGVPNDGEYTSTITQNRLSLIGNPYPSALNADQFITDNTANIVGTLYFYESGNDTSHVRGTYTGGYATRAIGVGTPFGGGKTPGQYIGVGQAFFVWRSDAGSANIQFNNNQRAFETIGGTNEFFSKTQNASKINSTIRTSNDASTFFHLLRVGFSFNLSDTEKYHRQVAIGFRDLTDNFENGYDAEMFDRKPTDMALKQNDTSSPMVITGIQNFNEEIEIPLTVFLDADREVTFSIDERKRFKSNRQFYLKDAVENKYYNVTENKAALFLDAGTYNDRFFITFKNDSALSVENEIVLNSQLTTLFNVNSQEIVLTKTSAINISKIILFNVNGKAIKEWKPLTNKNTLKFLASNIKNGIYFLKINTNKGVVNKKIIVVQ